MRNNGVSQLVHDFFVVAVNLTTACENVTAAAENRSDFVDVGTFGTETALKFVSFRFHNANAHFHAVNTHNEIDKPFRFVPERAGRQKVVV